MDFSEKLCPPAAAPAAEDRLCGDLKETELRLGLPGLESPDRKGWDQAVLMLGPPKAVVSGAKRGFSDAIDGSNQWFFPGGLGSEVEPGKGSLAQVVGWPPIRSYRKNTLSANPPKNSNDPAGKQELGCLYVKVSMDGAPYLRKVDLKTYCNYEELSSALEKMFSCFTIAPDQDELSESCLIDLLHGSEYVLTYEDKDGDWMLVGDVPWDMFTASCKRLRIMKGSEAIGLGTCGTN
ncbi:unnamed protein product [Spirodela intermedia]|uniref:Auxin-responsive protein n=1 Tax=Spirodela intermedia TaxID=51605 RepID=A0A7I8KZL9_SPIIN|nr:unnamed protein product [Spirodela intermedia]